MSAVYGAHNLAAGLAAGGLGGLEFEHEVGYGGKGHPASPQDQRYLSEQEKVNLWLPGASSDGGGSGRCRKDDGLSNSQSSSDMLESNANGPRDSLKLLKRRQGTQTGESMQATSPAQTEVRVIGGECRIGMLF